MVGVFGDSKITCGTLSPARRERGRFRPLLVRGEGERARDRNVLPAHLQCVVVRFGGAAVTWRGMEGSCSASRRQDGLPAPPEPWDQLEQGGSRRACGSPAACGALLVGGVGLLCFWIPVMELLEFCSRVEGRGAVCALPPPLPGV